jgi:hypothetical protein
VTSFIALYKGETVSGARLVALTADPRLVRDFAAQLISGDPSEHLEPDLHLVKPKQSSNSNEIGVPATTTLDPPNTPRAGE